MTLEQKEQIKEQIILTIAALHGEIAELEKRLQPIEPDCCLQDLRFEMMQEQDVFDKALQNAQIRVRKLKYIFATFESDENYGICINCDEEIAFERLLLVPEAKTCVEC